MAVERAAGGTSLIDVLDRVLDKGIVIDDTAYLRDAIGYVFRNPVAAGLVTPGAGFVGIMPGWEMPRFAIPSDRKHTIPYGVAIMLGSLLAAALFRP